LNPVVTHSLNAPCFNPLNLTYDLLVSQIQLVPLPFQIHLVPLRYGGGGASVSRALLVSLARREFELGGCIWNLAFVRPTDGTAVFFAERGLGIAPSDEATVGRGTS
jgi:hypothetical protein